MKKARKPTFLRADTPPQLGTMTHVMKIVDAKHVTVCIAGLSWQGYWSHWYKGSSHRCLGTPSSCKPARKNSRVGGAVSCTSATQTERDMHSSSSPPWPLNACNACKVIGLISGG